VNIPHDLFTNNNESPGLTSSGIPLAAWNGFDLKEVCDIATPPPAAAAGRILTILCRSASANQR